MLTSTLRYPWNASSRRSVQWAHRGHTSSPSSVAIRATQNWLERVVVDQKLCPFAPPFVRNPTLIRIVESKASNPDEASRDVTIQRNELMRNEGEDASSSSSASSSKHETTLIAFSDPYFVARGYREFVRLSWKLQEEVIGDEYLGKLQLVLFHPSATHQTYGEEGAMMLGEETNICPNAADYTIRSPFPTIHLLREADVMRAVAGGYPDLESLPSRNKMKFIEQGVQVCKKRLDECLTGNG